jgi:hypothetical protein
MKNIKLFEDFKVNNIEGDLITVNDIIQCIKSDGVIYAETINDYPDNNKDEPLKPVSVDNDGIVTVIVDSMNKEVSLNNITRVEF